MRLVELHLEAPKLDATPEQHEAFRAWLDREVEDAHSARNPQEQVWRESLRQYDANPRVAVRNVPIENAPNIEVPVGAIATDEVYAQIIDLIFNIQPIVTCRPVGVAETPEMAVRREQAVALQEHINWGVANEWGVRQAAEESILDDVKLGTGIYYVPFVEDIRKTRDRTVTQRGPRVLTHPVEDFFVPGGSYGDLQRTKWCAFRFWYNEQQLIDQGGGDAGWNIGAAQSAVNVGWVRNRREMLGRTWRNNIYSELFEIWKIYCYFDIDGDGIDEDLIAIWDRTSRQVLHLSYNTYDRRPGEAMRYQIRGHLFYGIGVMDMTSSLQTETSDIHSFALTNALLASARFWKAKDGSLPETMTVWPGKVQFMNNPEDLDAVQMSDIHPSMIMMQQFPMMLAERRVGLNSMTKAPTNLASSRTPGITAISLLNQANKRFTPAFDGVRLATAAAVKQCLYREQERLLDGDPDLEDHLRKVHGNIKGQLIIDLLRDPDFDDSFVVELTASSATVNRDVERQNAILLVNFLGQYYQRVLELVAIASNPQTPPAVADAARKIADAAGAIVQRTLTTFDQVRDPSTFIVDINDELDAAVQPAQQGMQLLQLLLQSALGGGSANGLAPSGVTVG